jgi:hypothetical protein
MEGHGSRSGIPLSPTTLLAVLTLAGSVLLVSHKLSSDRPVASAGSSYGTIGDQLIDTRLWEDPFPAVDQTTAGQRANVVTDIPALQNLISSRAGTNSGVLLLPVMVSGGPYSEDREGRIRSRFAVVSALSQQGYAPDDAEHIGALDVPWLSAAVLETNLATAASCQEVLAQARGATLRVNYEWYRRRVFGPDSGGHGEWVLALWLDEDQFTDYPLLRIALLLQPFLSNASSGQTNLVGQVALLGPGRSATLRAMLPGEFSGQPPSKTMSPGLWLQVTNALQRVDLFTATASAMDEVLVNAANYGPPRAAVVKRLTNGLFRVAFNFAATDSQYAGAVLDELSLREVDVDRPVNHLVLISEWDSFYGRTLSLTYAAELAVFQGRSPSRAQFVDDYRRGQLVWPTNLHSFLYLRGLDGQTTAKDVDGGASRGGGESSASEGGQSAIQTLRRWTPEANKPEGRAQFDYLERLGDRIARLDRELRHRRQGSVGAIGIVGSDVYDTLLILQALRHRFPGVVFFMTDLDARLWAQAEWQWARNLVVVSAYGLQLNQTLQSQVPPFRDSQQTALFAATLAALGNERLLALPELSPRRFEIGRFGPIDLSQTNVAGLHPLPPGMRGATMPRPRVLISCFLALLFATALATLIFRPWIHLTRERRQYEAESLWIREEDIGGVEGFRLIQKQLRAPSDPLIQWLAQELGNWPVQQGGTDMWSLSGEHAESGISQKLTDALEVEDQMQRFLDFLNGSLQRNHWVPAPVLEGTRIIPQKSKQDYRAWAAESERESAFLVSNTLTALQHNRRLADELLDWLLRADLSLVDAKTARRIISRADAADSARRAGWQKFHLRHGRLQAFLISVGLFLVAALALAISAWRDTYANTRGEPFSLGAGVSAWPTECLRLGALALTIAFVAESYSMLRSTVLDLTRRFRLQFARAPGKPTWCLVTTPVPEAVVQADQLWEQYQQMGFWKSRCRRILLPLLAYIGFAICLGQLGSTFHRPLRGHTVSIWDGSLLFLAVISFLFLTFWTMDSARLCRWFIEHLSEAPTRYPKSTREFFSALRGGTPGHLLDEWIDLRLIAELTERVGRLIYFPFIVFFILLLSRNHWWDLWPWSVTLVVIFTLNLALAAAGLIILQRSAQRARAIAVDRLRTKVDLLREAAAVTEPQKAEKALGQAEKLLEEIQQLDSGAFGGFWDNPLIGALLVPSGGTAIVELIQYFIAR